MYNTNKATQYWGKRIKNFNLQSAVLSLSLPTYLNDAYRAWEFKTLKKTLGKIKNKKIIDIACGGGRVSVPLAKMGAQVTGIDISQEMIRYANEYAKKNSCSSNVNFIVASAWDTKLPSYSFDKVLLLGILEHLPPEYKKLAIKEAYRLVRRKGTIHIVVNNKKSIFLNLVEKWKKPTQRKSGYYSSLMDPHQIIAYLKSLNLKVSVINSNLHYSILLHALDRINPRLISKSDINKISELFEYCIDLDLNKHRTKLSSKLYESLEEKFADQYFLLATRK